MALVLEEELSRLGIAQDDFQFKRRKNLFGRRTRSRRESTSEAIERTAISQADFERLVNFDPLSGKLSSLEDIGVTTSTFNKQNRKMVDQKTGGIFTDTSVSRKGEELSVLDQEGFDALIQSIGGRQQQIQKSQLAPGFERQSFSLLSGNFS